MREDLFEKVVAEVLRRLKEIENNRPVKALTLFTGASIGVTESLEQLREIKGFGWELIPVLTPAAQQVVGIHRIQETLGSVPVLTEEEKPNPYQLTKEVDLVLIPVLTINTVAKIALGMLDNLVTTIVGEAIMMGKPVLAVRDGADLQNPDRERLGLDRAPAPWQRMVEDNFSRLEQYGIRLVSAAEFAATAAAVMGSPQSKGAGRPSRGSSGGQKSCAQVVTRADVISAWEEGKVLVVGQGAVVTPLARDVAREYGVELLLSKGKDE